MMYNEKRIEKSNTTLNAGESFIFVYGTLLKGRSNYERHLAPANPVMRGEIEGFEMYDLGSFPGVVKGIGRVKGEVYRVTKEQLERIDFLEGEGSLYKKEAVTVKGNFSEDGEVTAYVYLYNQSIDHLPKIPYEAQPYKNSYVWYVAYGSNLLKDRLACYIEGGYCERNGREYPACADDTLPSESVSLEMLGNMYFANFNQGAWENSAVSFFDADGISITIGRAYLIKESQLEHIHKLEGKGANWYPDTMELGELDGIRAVTFTNKNVKPSAPMCELSGAYISTIMDGLHEMGYSAEYAFHYITECTARLASARWTKEDAIYEEKERRNGLEGKKKQKDIRKENEYGTITK